MLYESHVLVEPIDPGKIEAIKHLAGMHEFRMSPPSVFMFGAQAAKRRNDFFSSECHAEAAADARCIALVRALQENGCRVIRYKTERSITDSSVYDKYSLLRNNPAPSPAPTPPEPGCYAETKARVRSSDPATSVGAAERAAKFAGGHYLRITESLKTAAGCREMPAQLSAHEISKMCGLTVVQIDRRLPELRKAGIVRVVVDPVTKLDIERDGFRVWELVK